MRDILMVGTDLTSKGGVSAVINLYRQGRLFERVLYLPSYTDGSVARKIIFYLAFLARFLHRLITEPGIRIVHIHSASYGSFFRKSWVALLARAFGKKVIMHIHGAEFHLFYEKANPLTRFWIRHVLWQADRIIALSRQWRDTLARISKNPRVQVIYNPTLMNDMDNGHDNTQAENRPRPVRFLFMGRLGQRKGVYDLIESAGHLQNPNIRILLYGDGEVNDIRARVSRARVGQTVIVGGWIAGPQKEEALRQADVLVLPSYNEGLPISILEAMAHGKPVIATDVGGIAEAVEDNVNGFLLQPGDFASLARHMETLAACETLRHTMGMAGYEKARRQFALGVVEKQLDNLYNELLEK